MNCPIFSYCIYENDKSKAGICHECYEYGLEMEDIMNEELASSERDSSRLPN